MNPPCPTRSSTLSPKIQRYHMLPITCIQPPCRNIDVMSVGHEKCAGTTPKVAMKRFRSSCDSDSSNNHARLLRTMIVMVMYGVVRDGITSRSGIIQSFYDTASTL